MNRAAFLDRARRDLLSPTFVSVLVLVLLWALFAWRLLTPNPADRVVFAEGDFTLHYYPFASYQAERVWQGELPLWNPYNHAGDPFAANVQWGTWSPVRWLTILLSGSGGLSIEAYQFEVAIHILMASLFTYAFLRVIMSSPWTALAGAILFAYGGYLTGYPILQPSVMYAAVWLPLALLGVYASVHRPGWAPGGVAGAGLAIGVSFFGGHPQTTMYLTYLALAYLAFEGWRARVRWTGLLWRAALMGVIGGGVAAVLLLPAAEFAGLTSRIEAYGYLDKSGGFMPIELLGVVLPLLGDGWSPLYIGVAGLLLAVGALLRPRREHWFWLGVAVVALWLGMGRNSIVYDAFYSAAPGFSTFRQQERVAYLFSFALTVLAAYQLDWLLCDRNAPGVGQARNRFERVAGIHLIAAAGALALAIVAAGARPVDLTGSPLPNVLAFVTVVSLLFNGWLRWQRADAGPAWRSAGLLSLLLAADLLTVGTRNGNYVPAPLAAPITPPEAADRLTPDGPVLWRVDGAMALEGYGTYWRIPDIYGTGPFTLASIDALRTIPVDRFWEVLAVRYASVPQDVTLPESVPLELLAYGASPSGQPYQLLELTDPRPLAWPVYDYREASGSAEFARQIMSDPAVDLREMAVTLYPLPVDLPGERPDGVSVTIERPHPEHLRVVLDTPENTLLTVAIVNYPGWQATVDGEPVPIVDTYAGLIGVPVEAGEGVVVELTFRPRLVLAGGVASGVALLAALVMVGSGVVRGWREREW